MVTTKPRMTTAWNTRNAVSSPARPQRSRAMTKAIPWQPLPFRERAVQITAGGNTNVIGSNVVGTHDVAISSGKDTSISSAEEYERHDYAKQVKKSGLLSGGGLGFTIGTEKRKDQYAEWGLMQKGSLIDSAKGYLSISSSGQKNKASRAVSMDISLGTARSTSSSESVTPQASVHFKRALLYVNEMRFTAIPLRKGSLMM